MWLSPGSGTTDVFFMCSDLSGMYYNAHILFIGGGCEEG